MDLAGVPAEIVEKSSPMERAAIAESMRKLQLPQRLYLLALLSSASRGEARRRLAQAGYDKDRATLHRWERRQDFMAAWRILEGALAKQITKDGVILKTQALIEEAMTPRPILYKGMDTGHEEIELGAAIRALELQGKAVGAWQDDVAKVAVVVDIDFSGPAEKLEDPLPALEAEYEEVSDAREDGPVDDWLD
jgi:hypothetical protein